MTTFNHLTKIENYTDPTVRALLAEISQGSGFELDEAPRMSLFTYFGHWAQVGKSSINASHFPIDGIWSMRISELPEDQLLTALKALVGNKGGSIEQYGDVTILNLLKKLFPRTKIVSQRSRSSKPQPNAQQRLIAQRRLNGTL